MMQTFAEQYPYGMPYHKIEGPFRRDPSTNKIIRSEWRSESVNAMRDLAWIFTAGSLGLPLVPEFHTGTLADAMAVVEGGLVSSYGKPEGFFFAEGLVGVPEIGGYDRYGNRIIVKIKAEDFR